MADIADVTCNTKMVKLVLSYIVFDMFSLRSRRNIDDLTTFGFLRTECNQKVLQSRTVRTCN